MNQKEGLKRLSLDSFPSSEPKTLKKSTDAIQKLIELHFAQESPTLSSRLNFSFSESPISMISTSKHTSLTIRMNEYLTSLKRDVEFIRRKLVSREAILVEKAKEKEELVALLRDLEENASNSKACGCSRACAIF